jgi:hypothetical protein
LGDKIQSSSWLLNKWHFYNSAITTI